MLTPLRGYGRSWFVGLSVSAFLLTLAGPFASLTPFFAGMVFLFIAWAMWLHGVLRYASSCLSGTANGTTEPDFGMEMTDLGADWAVSGFGLALYWVLTGWALVTYKIDGSNVLLLSALLLWWPFGFALATTRGNGWSLWDVPSALGLVTRSPARVLAAGFIGGCATVVGTLVHSWVSGGPAAADLVGQGGLQFRDAIALMISAMPTIYGMAVTGALLGRIMHDSPEVAEGL